MALHPERALRVLDQLDCLGGALCLAWAGYRGRWLRAASLGCGFAFGLAIAQLPPF